MMKRKRIFALSAVMAVMVLFGGCGMNQKGADAADTSDRTAEEYVALTQEKLVAAESFQGAFHGEVQMGEDKTENTTDVTIQMIRTPLTASVNINTGFGSVMQTSDMYLEETSDSVNMYMAFDGQWTEMTLSKEDIIESVALYDAQKNFEILLTAGTDWVEKTNENGTVTLSGVIPAEKVYSVVEEANFLQLAGMSGIAETYYKDIAPVNFEVMMKEDGMPISFTVDFSKTLEIVTNKILKELSDTEPAMQVQKYLVKQEITSLGDVKKIEIPAQAKDSAINYEREISLLEDSTTSTGSAQ